MGRGCFCFEGVACGVWLSRAETGAWRERCIPVRHVRGSKVLGWEPSVVVLCAIEVTVRIVYMGGVSSLISDDKSRTHAPFVKTSWVWGGGGTAVHRVTRRDYV